jgi:VIT1/CCC1 family predicted Fe2+/Mn2+ transporter
MDPPIEDDQLRQFILTAQKNEITEYYIYQKLARSAQNPENQKVLEKIATEELTHYHFWEEYTQKSVSPNKLNIWFFYLLARIFGLTFSIKLMEKGEERAQESYATIIDSIPPAKSILEDEDEHEKELIGLIDEERLKYVGSMVLGLNDALVELTGALAGFTFALQNAGVIATAGLITGIAASFSMAASEYLSTKSGESTLNPAKAAIYTGGAYILTVFFLIAPFLLLENHFLCLGVTVINAIIIILIFTFYISVAKDLPFRKRFLEMAFISLGIAGLSFIIGILVRLFLNVDI